MDAEKVDSRPAEPAAGGRVVQRIPGGPLVVAEPWGPVPVVALQIWLPVGAVAESPGLHGAAHLLEHLVFRGAGDRDGAAIMADAEAIGADLNAWTSVEQTAFHLTLPAERVHEGLALLWDLVFRPWLRDEDLASERPIVLEEIRGCADDPAQVLADALRARLYGDHAYGRSVLGTVDSVSGIDADALRAFHRGHYRPERAVLVVAGPVSMAELCARIATLPGAEGPALPPLAPPPPAVLPVDRGIHLVPAPFKDLRLEVAFPVGGPTAPEVPALDLVGVALGVGAAGLLTAHLRQELDAIHGCTAAVEMEVQGGAVVLSLSVRPGEMATALAGVARVLAEVRATGIPAAARERARALVRAERLHERETVAGRANRLGWYQLHHGGPEGEQAYLDALEAVDGPALRAAADRWLDPARACVVALGPAEELDAAALAAAWQPPARPPRARRRPGPRLFVGPGGVRVLVEPCETDELVGISVMGRGGSLAGPADLPGAGVAWSEVVERGAGGRDALAFAGAVEIQAGTVAAWSARNSFGIQASFPRDQVWGPGQGLSLVGDLLFSPHFAADEVERAQRDLLEGRDLIEDDPEALAWELAWARLFPGHPWGRPDSGTRASLRRLSPGRLRALHRRIVTGANLCIGVVGRVDPDAVEASLCALLDGLLPGAAVPLQPPTGRARAGRSVRHLDREDAPAQVVLGWRAPGRDQEDWAPALVLDGILGGSAGVGGRLFQRVREDAGLAYDVGSSLEGGLGGGALFCAAGTEAGEAGRALGLMRTVVRELAAAPVPADELARVQQGLVAAAMAATQRATARADQLAGGQLYRGEGLDWRARLRQPLTVGADAVQAVAARYLADDAAVELRVLPRGGGGRVSA